MSKLNNQSFNLMKALEEAETFEINKKVTVDSYHENLIESKKLVESDYYYDDDFNERTKYLIQRISDVETFIKLLIQEFGEYEYEDEEDKEADYNYEEGGHVIQVGDTTFYTNEAMNDIWSYDNGDPSDTMEELLDNENIAEFLLGEGLISDEDDRFEDEFDESVNLKEERLGNNTFTDRDEAEYYRNKELYHQSGLARHKKAMDKAKEACKNKGIEVDETEGVYESCNKKLKEDEDTSKEERLASLKTQLEQDGDQLSDDEKEAIQAEINELENEEPSMNESVTIDEVEEITQRIESAQDMDEIQQIIYTISDGVLENEVQNTFDGCNEDDDLDEVKSLVLTTLEDNAEYEEESLTEASTPNVEKFIYDLDVDSGNAWSVNYNDRKRGVEVYKNGKSEKTVDDIIKAVTSKYPQLKVSMKGKNTVLFKYDDKDKSLKEDETPEAMQAIADKQMPEGGYRYIARHSIGPGTLPNDVKVFKTEDTDNGKIAMYISRPLTSEELKKYDIDPEWIQEDATMKRYKVSFYVDTDTMNNMDIEEKVTEILAGSGLASTDETIDVENITDLTEADDNKYEESEETLEDTINRAHEEELSAIDTYNAVLDKTDESTDTKLIEMINEIKADEEDHKLLLQHYIETGEALSDDELETLKNSEESTEEPIEESENRIAEEKVTNLKEVKSQGNIFMLQDNKRFIVGENYDEAQGLIENAEIYDNKDDADKDYLDRCDITKDGKKVQLNGQDEIDKE